MRRFRIIVLILPIFAGIAFWWLVFRPTIQAEKTVSTSKPVAQISIPQVASPVVAPVEPATASPDASVASVAAVSDPQSELNTAIPDLIYLMQSGDLLTAYERYMPPSYFAQMPQRIKDQLPQQMQNMQTDPNMRQTINRFVEALQLMQSEPPAYNAAGDRATYSVSDPSGRNANIAPFTFQKIDGKWYVLPERGLEL